MNNSIYGVVPNGVCNGDGDGQIGGACYDNHGANDCLETAYFWIMLFKAGLTNFAAGYGLGGVWDAPGLVVPATKIHPITGIAAYYVQSGNYYSSAIDSGVPSDSGHVWRLGAQGSSQSLDDIGLSASEAHAIDMKIDDGNALGGRVLSTNSRGGCSDGSGNYLNKNIINAYAIWWDGEGCIMDIKANF